MLRRTLMNVLLLGLAAYATVCALLFLFQERLVFFPGSPPRTGPEALGLEYRRAAIETSDGPRLHGWFLPGGRSGSAVLVSHGNAGSVEQRLALGAALVGMGHSVLLYDYRGFGLSEGRPTESGTYLDAEAAWDWLAAQPEVDPDRIALFGESLGAAVSVELAGRRPAAALVLEAPFTSVADVGARVYPWLPVRLLARIEYDNLSKIGGLDLPLLVAHSPGDRTVPVAQGRALHERAPGPKAWLETTGDHQDGGFLRSPEHVEAVRAFLAAALR